MHTISPPSRASRIRRRRAASRRRREPKHSLTPFPVFIAYADVPAARHAMAQLTAVLHTTRSGHRLQPMLWRFDQLDERHWREMALGDAAAAAAVVIALSDEMPLNSAAEAWLTTLAARHRGASINVLAILNEELWAISLQQTAAVSEKGAAPGRATKKNPPTLVALPEKKIAVRAA